MDFNALKKMAETRNKGVPEDLADRKILETSDIREPFTNDVPVVIIRKPKNMQAVDEDGNRIKGRWVRVYSKDGSTPIFQDVAYIPILYRGEKCLIITAVYETIRPLSLLMEDYEHGVIVKGTGPEDIDRWERFEAPECIDGKLTFENVDKKYANGNTYPVPVLASYQ